MKKKATIFVIVLLTLFNLTALTTVAYRRWAIEDGGRPIEHFGPSEQMLKHRIGLDDEQMSRLREVRLTFAERTEPLKSQLGDLNFSMFELMKSGSPDTTAIFAVMDSIGAIQSALQKEGIKHILDEGTVFTPEQRQKLFRMFGKHMDRRWGQRGHPGRGMHGGDRFPFDGPKRGKGFRDRWNRDSNSQIPPGGMDKTDDRTLPPGSAIDNDVIDSTQGGN
jgi:Spy/CpxP family protein refolding chaperone